MKAIFIIRKFLGLTLESCVKKERLEERVFLARLKKRITPYVLSLSLLAGAYVDCSKDRASSGDHLESRTKITFESYRDGNMDIYVMNPDGSNQTRLTNNPAKDEYPSWSPDGKKIAFQTTRNEKEDVYVMNSDGSSQTRLTDNPAFDGCLSWSPDGNKIAFASIRDGNFEIYVMNADGSEQTNLTNNPSFDMAPSWSPDGKKIAFYSLRKDVPDQKEYGADGRWWYEYNAEIYVMNADGSELTNITNNPAYDGYPSWSPLLKTDK